MKILNNLNTTSIINKIKYPFIQIVSLFHRVTTAANRIHIVQNPKSLSNVDIHESTKSPRSGRTEGFTSYITIDEERSNYQDLSGYRLNSPSYITIDEERSNYQDLSGYRLNSPSDIAIDEERSNYQDLSDYRLNSPSDSKHTNVKEFQDVETFNNRPSQKTDPTHLYTRINKTGNGKIDRYLPSEEKGISNQTAESPERKNSQLHPFLKEVKEVEIDPPFVPPRNKALRREVLQRDACFLKFPLALKEMRLTILKGSELFI